MAFDGTTSELVNRNFNRIESAMAARVLANPLPSTPVLGDHPATPTIGLAYSTDASLNATWEAIDGLFATPTLLKPIRFTDNEVINRNIWKVINAFLSFGIQPRLADFIVNFPEPFAPPEEPPPPEPEPEV
jgi:hypothetical protein